MSQFPQKGQFNSNTRLRQVDQNCFAVESQSPQTGQFNSNKSLRILTIGIPNISLNPLKRVNSILT